MAKPGPKPGGPPQQDLSGRVFGKLKVVSFVGRSRHHKAQWLCLCECGGEKVVLANNLLTGGSRSCGHCLKYIIAKAKREKPRRAPTKGRIVVRPSPESPSKAKRSLGTLRKLASKTPEYRKWKSAKERCSPTFKGSARYFDRGIAICDEWQRSFAAFYEHIGPCPPGYTLDRIDNDKGYEPGNVRWADRLTQARNKSNNTYITHNGKTMTIAEWAMEIGMWQGTISYRLRRGWPIEQVLNPHLTISECVSLGLKLSKRFAAVLESRKKR